MTHKTKIDVPTGWTDAVQTAISQLIDATIEMAAKIKELNARIAALEAAPPTPQEEQQL